MTDLSRRDLLALLTAGTGAARVVQTATGRPIPEAMATQAPHDDDAANVLRIRAIVAGVELSGPGDFAAVERAAAIVARAKARAIEAGYSVQTLRIATNPIIAALTEGQRHAALPALRDLDAIAVRHDCMLSIGPLLIEDRAAPGLAEWAAELARLTRMISFSVSVASQEGGIHRAAIAAAAQVMQALSSVDASGAANFRFAAAAAIPAGTPFFPVAYHQGSDSIALGVESAGLVQRAFRGAGGLEEGGRRLHSMLQEALAAVERLGSAIAAAGQIRYLGIDPSPAPGLDRSIGAAIETVTGVPFGSPSTLQACATITAVLKSLAVRSCGYAGLMLPVLEDPVLAARAGERRYGLQELLLYSSVCGTGLDVVPLPGDIEAAALQRIIGDVASLATRLRKPLAARLFPAPGRKAGEVVRFNDERLVACRVFDV